LLKGIHRSALEQKGHLKLKKDSLFSNVKTKDP